MNNTTQNRQGSSFKVSYPDFPSFDLIPRFFRLHQEAGKQDVIEVTYPQLSTFFTKALATGVPIKVIWNNGSTTGTFLGYVWDSSSPTQQTIKRDTVIRAIGASLALKESASKIWINKTAPEIVTNIATTFKLNPVVTPDALRFGQQSMVGHTYWQKIQELARRIGFVAQVYGTDLHFHPIDTMIDKFTTSIPVLSFNEPTLGAYAAVMSQTLDYFKPRVGDYTERAAYTNRTKTLSGADPITGNSYTVSAAPHTVGKNLRASTKAPLFNEVLSSTMSGSKSSAKSAVEANAQLSRFSIHASGAGQGDPRIAPYKTVEINGTDPTTDGFWIVNKASHFVHMDGRYQVEFTCMTDGVGANQPTSARPSQAGIVPVRNIAHDLSVGITRPTISSLSAQTAMISTTNTGFQVTPRRWVGH